MKARIFLSDSHAVKVFSRNATRVLAALRHRTVPADLWSGILFLSVPENKKLHDENSGLANIARDLMGFSLSLRGGSDQLVLAVICAGFGLSIRLMEHTLAQARIRSEMNYRWLINSSEWIIHQELNAIFHCLSRHPHLFQQLETAVDVPVDHVRAVFSGFIALSKVRLGWNNVVGTIQLLSAMMGYTDLCSPDEQAVWTKIPLPFRYAVHEALRRKANGGKMQRTSTNALHFCVACAQGGLDAEGEDMFTVCAYCRSKFCPSSDHSIWLNNVFLCSCLLLLESLPNKT